MLIFSNMENNPFIIRAVVRTKATGAIAPDLYEELLNKNSVLGL